MQVRLTSTPRKNNNRSNFSKNQSNINNATNQNNDYNNSKLLTTNDYLVMFKGSNNPKKNKAKTLLNTALLASLMATMPNAAFKVNADSDLNAFHDAIHESYENTNKQIAEARKYGNYKKTTFLEKWNNFTNEEKQIYELIETAEHYMYLKEGKSVPPTQENVKGICDAFKIPLQYSQFVQENLQMIYNEYEMFNNMNIFSFGPTTPPPPLDFNYLSPRRSVISDQLTEILDNHYLKTHSYPDISEENVDAIIGLISEANQNDKVFIAGQMVHYIKTSQVINQITEDTQRDLDNLNRMRGNQQNQQYPQHTQRNSNDFFKRK